MTLLFENECHLSLRKAECRTDLTDRTTLAGECLDGLFLLAGNFVHSSANFHVYVPSDFLEKRSHVCV